MRTSANFPKYSLMPKLSDDLPSCRMHLMHHAAPTGERRIARHQRNVLLVEPCITTGSRVVDGYALGDDQARATLSAATIVSGHILPRDTTRTHAAGHRGHYDPVL